MSSCGTTSNGNIIGIDFQDLGILTDLVLIPWKSNRNINRLYRSNHLKGYNLEKKGRRKNIPIITQPTNPVIVQAKETQEQDDNQHPQPHIQPHYIF